MMQRKSNLPPFLCFFIVLFFLTWPVSALAIPSGTPDPDFVVDIYKPDKVWPGTTLFADYHTQNIYRIVEVNMKGEIVWQYTLPENLKMYAIPGFDVQLLPNNHIMYLLPRNGVYEIDRSGNVLWSYLDPQGKISHNFKRLPNGNTLINRGNEDTKDTAQAVEVDPQGNIVWQWYAKSAYDKAPYLSIYREGWAHANAVTRLPNGNTLIDMRNFNITAEVNPQGNVVWQYDWTKIGNEPHEPEIQPNGNILICLHWMPDQVVELNPKSNEIVWRYIIKRNETNPGVTRDADRLPNGNTLINDGIKIIEVTPSKEIVWQLTLTDLGRTLTQQEQRVYLYKSERIGQRAPQISIQNPKEGVCSPKKTEISIQYDNTDLGTIWYRVFDRTKNSWVTENITYVRNKWANAITFEGKEIGQQNVTLEEGNYTLYVWAASTGWGDENLYTPKVINIAERKVNFSVTTGCTMTSAAPIPPFIALLGVCIAGLLTIFYKNKVR